MAEKPARSHEVAEVSALPTQRGTGTGPAVVPVRRRRRPHRTPTLDELVDSFREPGRPDYDRLRQDFQREHGTIRESWFAHNFEAGALLVKPPGPVAELTRTRSIWLRYDGLVAALVQPELEEAIRRARALDRESGLILGGRSRKVLVEMIYAILVYLLGVLDATAPTATSPGARQLSDEERRARVASALVCAKDEIARLERFAKEAAKRASLRWYLLGLPVGVALGIVLVVAADTWAAPLVGAPSDAVKVCTACGAVGAVMSVMIRVTRGQRLEIDSQQGHAVTLLAGGFRPLIGAVFGVALYVFVKSGLLPIAVPTGPDDELLFFAALAFLAGFSERWAQDTIVKSTPALGPTTSTTPKPPAKPPVAP